VEEKGPEEEKGLRTINRMALMYRSDPSSNSGFSLSEKPMATMDEMLGVCAGHLHLGERRDR
jgi:hypothetical protein